MAAQPAPLQAVLQVGQMVALRGAVQASLELVAQPVVPQVEQKVDQLALSQEVQMVVRLVLPRVALQVGWMVVRSVPPLAVQQALPSVVQSVLPRVALQVGWMAVQRVVLQAAQMVKMPPFLRKHRLDGHLLLVQSGPHPPCQRRSPIEGSHFNQLAEWVARQSDS